MAPVSVERVSDPARLRAAGLDPIPGFTAYKIEGPSALQVQREIEIIMQGLDCPAPTQSEFGNPRKLDPAGTQWRATGYAVHREAA